MDLTKFTNSKQIKTQKIKKELILDNEQITIYKFGNEIEFTIKKKSAFDKYENFLFLSPTKAIITDSDEKANDFFSQSINQGVEGLMFKNLNSIYKPGLRTGAMAKLKETKEDIDVVIIAAEHGLGKRAGYFSSFHVAVKNDNPTGIDDEYLEIGKVSSGIKEIGEEGASLKNLTKLLLPIKIKEENSITYFEPKIILQIKYQQIQKSTIYKSGYALRFPRIIMLREDKTLDEINSIRDVENF